MESEVWGGRVSVVHDYEPFDDMVRGDSVFLGGSDKPRKVLSVKRSPRDDAVRVITITRLKSGTGSWGGKTTGPVAVFRSDLKAYGNYRFRGYHKRKGAEE